MSNSISKEDKQNTSPEVICVGQMVVDCITRNRRITSTRKNVYTADGISLNPGGDALNEAINLTRLGHRVRLVGALGQDAAGHLLLDVIRRHQISPEGIVVDDSVTTPVANIMVYENGERESTNSPATLLGSFQVDASIVEGVGARVLSLASLFRAPLDRPETVINLIRQAKSQGMIVCADTKLPTFRKINLSDLEEVLPLIDYIFPNENEAGSMTGETDFERMTERLSDRGIRNVIIKAGLQGCFVRDAEGHFTHIPALPVTAIDSTGAGDSFVAGFISGLLRDQPIEECCRLGTECAAECVQRQGAT